MDLSGQSTIQTQHAVVYNTINNISSTSEHACGTKYRSYEDAEIRKYLATRAIQSASLDASERGDPPKCHPDTRIAVQDSLKAWRSDRAAGPIRLISGWAGTGKTTVAQTMAEHWAKEGQLAGSFFFSRSSEERSDTDWVCGTLLHQFLQTFGEDVDVGHLPVPIFWSDLLDVLLSTSPSLPQPVVIVIDGLDECSLIDRQLYLLGDFLESLDELVGASIKILISCRPERHLEKLFNKFAPQLGSSYRIHLGQSPEDKDDIRTFLRVSFDRICQDRRDDGAMSIADGVWPSQKEIEELVDRASGQFILAATVIRFVDDETEDPVEMLNLILERRTSSFGAIDQLYAVILNRVGKKLNENKKPLELRQLTQNLILSVNHEPSSSLAIAEFWFEKEVTINILVKHLQALLVRQATDADSQASQDSQYLIQFRHKSFHDFVVRPSASHDSHPFSLAEMNPASKFFFSLRILARNVASGPGILVLHRSQQLGYTFLCCDDHLPADLPYEEEARRRHQSCMQDRTTFRGCMCLPRLYHIMSDISALRTFKLCGQSDCVIDENLLTLCRTTAMPTDDFIRVWKEREHSRPFLFRILKFLLWLRVMLYGLLADPSSAAYGTIRALISRPSSLSWKARCIAVIDALFCTMVLLNTRYEVVIVLYVAHVVASLLLDRFLRFNALQIEPGDSSIIM